MKKTTALLLCFILMLSCTVPAFAAAPSESFGAYKHVYIIGWDGSGAAWGNYDTPNFDRIFGSGACRYDCQGEIPTISAQNWGSILCGVSCDVHGFTNDNTADDLRYSDTENGTVFRFVREKMPDAKLASIVHWHNINKGIIENDLKVKKIWRQSDPMVVDAICGLFSVGCKPALMFVQLDDVDHAGHSYGGQTDGYRDAVIKADKQLGMIYDGISRAGGMEDALFILVADHGEADNGGHGGTTKEEVSCTVALAGKTVNNVTLPQGTRNRDVAAIALYALGVEQPSYMTAKVPAGLFGEEHGVNVEKSEFTLEKLGTGFLYAFVRFANLVCAPWDFIVV